MSSSGGEYKFNKYNETLKEVGFVGNEYDNPQLYANNSYDTITGENTPGTTMRPSVTKPITPYKSGGSGNKMILVIILLLLLVVISLLLVLVVISAYNMIQSTSDCKCESHNVAMSNDVTAGTQQTNDRTQLLVTCNTTEMQADLVFQITKSTNGSTHNVLHLLQELQQAITDFQANATEMMSNTEDSLEHIINTLSNHKDTSISTSSVVDYILIGVNELLDVHNTSSLYDSITPVSCKMIKEKLPDSPSGYYHVNARDIYCNMDELCGSGGGWTRLAYLDMTDSTMNCPDELQYVTVNGIRMCQRAGTSQPSCTTAVRFPSNGISYSEICGRIIGYEKGTPDGVTPHHGSSSSHNDLDSTYVDGVSLTKGWPREHVWTFIAGLLDNYYHPYNCPCNIQPGSGQQVPEFVGSHYFCESGNPNPVEVHANYYTGDPLWDGKQCGSQEGTCCGADGPPWFHRQYNSTTTDFLDMRICADQATDDENTPISFYEIFVR